MFTEFVTQNLFFNSLT